MIKWKNQITDNWDRYIMEQDAPPPQDQSAAQRVVLIYTTKGGTIIDFNNLTITHNGQTVPIPVVKQDGRPIVVKGDPIFVGGKVIK